MLHLQTMSVTWNQYSLACVSSSYSKIPLNLNIFFSCLHRASIVSKTLFIIPNHAHDYKIIGMSKTIKIPIIAPTCFGSRRNHHQGAISCLAETTVMILLCSSLMTWSMLWRHTSLLCKREVPVHHFCFITSVI